ncbi:hypothetical protein GALMADRAFT_84637 [Galerina marginata CBS 339.88]|uniref:Rsm22-domain-containing protein n=1 Tax=Galerina marginata (strain CBS 339.88) TaxID=685588 RepID=A0A067TR29_GALM3|nr:hypothetical protein GALMADRAFT_84637 [Galerina marginata CBS 339.88]
MLRACLLSRVAGPRPPLIKFHLTFAAFSSSISKSSAIPKPALHLDPSYETLLNDVDISLRNSKINPLSVHRELEIVSGAPFSVSPELSIEEWSPLEPVDLEVDGHYEDREHRKSPAALFGSNQISVVVLPLELQTAINMLIANGQKTTLRSDSMRLFKTSVEGSSEESWDSQYDTVYSSRQQAAKHAIRDGTAFATVALPAHYSAITSVFHHVRLRLEPSWEVDRIIDWGAGTGSGLWASLYSFHDGAQFDENFSEKTAVASKIRSYTGIDKREGLVSIGKKLLSDLPTSAINVKWKKSYREEDRVLHQEGNKTIALSAFMLTSLPNTVSQKTLVQEMWDSGAHTIILIDHNTKEGFEAIASAREYLLGLGQTEVEEPETARLDIHGCHVLAPCPHDHACPLLHSGGTPLVCGFSQRIQRPSFVRRTKHSGVGHEDIEYSYVVIRRGPRPSPMNTSVGRVGAIGKRRVNEDRLANTPLKELEIYTDETGAIPDKGNETPAIQPIVESKEGILEPPELQAQLRREAYQWPRLVFRPLKKSGHIILDSCTSEGKIMRLTIPKSQGKQPFYDARKSSWGDIFPHAPKNAPLERNLPKKKGQAGASTGSDIGKRRDSFKDRERPSYTAVAEGIREKKKKSKRDFALTRGNKVWKD